MMKKKLVFDDFLTMSTRLELRAAVTESKISFSIPQVQRLIDHVGTFTQSVQSLRLGIVHTYTSDLLDPWLNLAAALEGVQLHTYHAPYGVVVQEARADSGLVKHQPDLTLLMLRREDLHPDLSKPVSLYDTQRQAQLSEVVLERLHSMVDEFRKHNVGLIVLTLLPSTVGPALGFYDAQAEMSETVWWANLKATIGRRLRESVKSSMFLDLDEVLLQIGREQFFDSRFWYSAQFPFAAKAAAEFTRRVVGLGAVTKLPKAKVIVLDADNTLWGGIVGEDGMDGIALGPDYPGNAYIDFQRKLLGYQQRGFILALCSKNNLADVEQVLKEHPHQLLRDEHFAARRVNWLPKADNLVSLAEELNLGLDSFVFVDDSDHECAAIRFKLPQVEVIQTPAKPVDVPTCLERVARLEVIALTAEDLAKTEMYLQERRRRDLNENIDKSGGGIEVYLAQLNMKMRVNLNASSNVARLSQLTKKTNQFNLTTRRYDEHQIQGFIADKDWLVADFSLADVFGNSGTVGLALFRVATPQQAELDTFLMSCRVIGREAEAAFLHTLLRYMANQGIVEVIAHFKQTSKNDLVKNFLPEQSFELCEQGRYRRDLRKLPPQPESAFPIAVELVVEQASLLHA
jgi:FkbH-like protein